MVAAVIVLVGAVLLIAALVTPWYTTKISNGSISETVNFYPGLPGTNGTVQYSCSGTSYCPTQSSYTSSQNNLNNTGTIAETSFFLIIVGVIFGLLGAILGFVSRGNPRRAGAAMALALLAMLLAVAAFGAYAAALPGAVAKDTPDHNGSGPWSTFFGSNSSGGASFNWGPGVGWYLAIGGFVLLLIGAILLWTARKDPAPPAMMPPPPAPTGMPPAPPVQ
jgi:hypothetical protein